MHLLHSVHESLLEIVHELRHSSTLVYLATLFLSRIEACQTELWQTVSPASKFVYRRENTHASRFGIGINLKTLKGVDISGKSVDVSSSSWSASPPGAFWLSSTLESAWQRCSRDHPNWNCTLFTSMISNCKTICLLDVFWVNTTTLGKFTFSMLIEALTSMA